MNANARKFTDDVISAVEDGFLSWEEVAKACLDYLSEDDVEDMAERNDWNIWLEDEDEDEEDADFYGVAQGSEEADDILFALQVMYGEPTYTYSDFQKMNLSQAEVNASIMYVKKKGYNKFSYFDSVGSGEERIK